ncbi:family 2 glycosyl transferase [Flavobacterium limnosediminis JC2902]|uniref:Family 2 glycosyl transferase n=1 Tax=Flavobacterium limnosediminis JC2902 TaxID=1341181 RepID=V6SHM6_9FLAO|nr:glycosyltransferase [Flavobacterium limnosediminis]ESU25959.1 family 2 glycosyl transferase [Flavobacterium limnosediminis JC2902]
MSIKFSILITTKNRLTDLKITLARLASLLNREDVECLLYDDASSDGTVNFIALHYPHIKIFKNKTSLGLIHNRNVLLKKCLGNYAISLDDDAHFLSQNVLENIVDYFELHPRCGVIACRIFWGKEAPFSMHTNEVAKRVKGFVGCGHVWNLQAWRTIPDYPEWFVFYGEEEFASYHLFKKEWEVHYVPQLLVQHRVEVKARKKDADYAQRQRRSFRSGWYLYLLFFPLKTIPKKMVYTLWVQIKTKVLKGDLRASKGLVLALFDVILHLPRLFGESNRFTVNEYQEYSKLEETKIYWQPENEK